jgi:4'-phosphopantetheinyl transferase
LANRYFAALELQQLMMLESARRPLRFMQLWTLKEAFIKALGTGLATPLDHFAFDFSSTEQPRLHIYDPSLGPASRWRFHQFQIETDFLAAVGVLSEDVAADRQSHCDVRLHRWPGPGRGECD